MGLRVLSLFDGISCGRVALERAGIEVDTYYASEIEPHAINLTRLHYPDTIRLGDVTKVDATHLWEIDLLIGGSPCTNFSMAGKRCGMVTKEKVEITSLDQYLDLKGRGFQFEGQSYLFWEYVRLLKEVKPKHFLLENVDMAPKWRQVITDTLGVEPVAINSALLSAQNRVRLYWTDIPVTIPEDKGITLQDILDDLGDGYTNKATIVGRRLKDGHRADYDKSVPIIQCLEVRDSNRDKSNCLTTLDKDNVLTSLPIGRHPDAYGMISGHRLPFRPYTRRECERLQTLPEGYTDPIPESAAKKAMGNGWTVDVIAHILKGLTKTTHKSMTTFGDLKEGGYFYVLREDAVATAYKIKFISDHGSYIGISGVSCDPSKPDRGFNVGKDRLDTSVHDNGWYSYYSDLREVENALEGIIRDHESTINEIKNTLSQLAFSVYR